LRAMNFGPKELDALKEMNLADLYRADTLRVHCLKIALDRTVFWPMLDNLRHQRESDDLQRELLVADAPLEMMQQLFGWSSREYTRWRRLLTLAPSVGRPPELNETDTHALWYAWQERIEAREQNALSATDYLDLQQQTGIGLRSIWALVQRWETYGEGLSATPPDRVAEHGA
jgi:hypothetical protein